MATSFSSHQISLGMSQIYFLSQSLSWIKPLVHQKSLNLLRLKISSSQERMMTNLTCHSCSCCNSSIYEHLLHQTWDLVEYSQLLAYMPEFSLALCQFEGQMVLVRGELRRFNHWPPLSLGHVVVTLLAQVTRQLERDRSDWYVASISEGTLCSGSLKS